MLVTNWLTLSIHLKGNFDRHATWWTRVTDCSVSWKCVKFGLYLQQSNTQHLLRPHACLVSLNHFCCQICWTACRCVLLLHDRENSGSMLTYFLFKPTSFDFKKIISVLHACRSENTTLLPNGAIETLFQLQVNRVCYLFSIFSNSYLLLHFY